MNHYIKFINSRPIRNKIKFKTEHHHKVPKSLGGSNLDINKIHLVHHEHFIAHLILWKAFGGKMTNAFKRMVESNQNGKIKWLTSKQFSRLREDCSKYISKINKGPWSEESKLKQIETRKRNGISKAQLNGLQIILLNIKFQLMTLFLKGLEKDDYHKIKELLVV